MNTDFFVKTLCGLKQQCDKNCVVCLSHYISFSSVLCCVRSNRLFISWFIPENLCGNRKKQKCCQYHFFFFPVKSTLLLHQSPTTGLFPTKTYGDNQTAKVHDSLYCAACAWALALAYRWATSKLTSLLCYILLCSTLRMF